MKRVVYSSFLKFIAAVLFITSLVAGTLTAIDGVTRFFEDDYQIYAFESSFEESSYMASLLNYPEELVVTLYDRLLYEYDEYGRQIGRRDSAGVDFAEIKESLEDVLNYPYYSDRINYYVEWDGVVVTNYSKDPAELMNGEFYTYVKHEGLGYTEREGSFDRIQGYTIDYITVEHRIVVACSIKDDVAKEYRALWENQQKIVMGTITKVLICAVCALGMFIYLICVCGKNSFGETRTMWIDNVWAEVHVAFVIFFGVGAVILCALILDEYYWGNFPTNLINVVIGSATGIASAAVITSLLSIVRNIKCRRLLETSLVLRVLRWCIRILIKVVKCIFRGLKYFFGIVLHMLARKTGVLLIGELLVYTAVIGLFGVGLPSSPVWLFFGILLFLFACFLIGRRAGDVDAVKKGAAEVRGGNVTYKIPELRCADMNILASNINDIARGLDQSVAAKVKAERLKTELITNVSHDLKTPITSIISYTELLSKVEGLPDEARDYVSVIAKKSERLKNLTQDLFDISKAQSGNENVSCEKLDVSLLVSQSLAEHEREIGESGLTFCVDVPKEMCILADGRKMSRVISNLINNILKYTMQNTRVFITAAERGGEVVLELKNISSYPMDFTSDEIVGRFVRGDESRTAEGNGLGLAIAKSYTELCGGIFEVVIDGDMFKSIIRFGKYE